MNELGNQAGTAIMVAYLVQWLKTSGWFGFLTPASETRIKVAFGALAAFVTTVGIHYAFDVDLTGHSVFTLTIPTGAELFHSASDFGKQWAFQQFAYKTGVKA